MIPESLTQLVAFLEAEGFRTVEDSETPELFGDRRFRWIRRDLRVQVSFDRGRCFVDVSPAWWKEWFGYGLEIVIDTLDEVEKFTHLLTLRDATDILIGRLPEIANLLSSQDGCDLVEAKHHERAQRWFGA